MRHLDGRAENGVKNPQMLGVVGPRLLWSVGLEQMVAQPQCSPEPLNRTGRPFIHPPPSGPENRIHGLTGRSAGLAEDDLLVESGRGSGLAHGRRQ